MRASFSCNANYHTVPYSGPRQLLDGKQRETTVALLYLQQAPAVLVLPPLMLLGDRTASCPLCSGRASMPRQRTDMFRRRLCKARLLSRSCWPLLGAAHARLIRRHPDTPETPASAPSAPTYAASIKWTVSSSIRCWTLGSSWPGSFAPSCAHHPRGRGPRHQRGCGGVGAEMATVR